MNKLINIFLILILFSSCNNDKFQPNTQEQRDFSNKWQDDLSLYKDANNSIIKDSICEQFRKYFINKSVVNWFGTINEINNQNDYAEVEINQMYFNKNKMEMKYFIKIGKNSKAYNHIKSLNLNDTIRFSGIITDEKSLTDKGMITEPEIIISCSKIFNFDNNYTEKSFESSSSNSYQKFKQENNITSCPKCGSDYNKETYGEMCPACWKAGKGINTEKMEEKLSRY